jgi:hypothetical protein
MTLFIGSNPQLKNELSWIDSSTHFSDKIILKKLKSPHCLYQFIEYVLGKEENRQWREKHKPLLERLIYRLERYVAFDKCHLSTRQAIKINSLIRENQLLRAPQLIFYHDKEILIDRFLYLILEKGGALSYNSQGFLEIADNFNKILESIKSKKKLKHNILTKDAKNIELAIIISRLLKTTFENKIAKMKILSDEQLSLTLGLAYQTCSAEIMENCLKSLKKIKYFNISINKKEKFCFLISKIFVAHRYDNYYTFCISPYRQMMPGKIEVHLDYRVKYSQINNLRNFVEFYGKKITILKIQPKDAYLSDVCINEIVTNCPYLRSLTIHKMPLRRLNLKYLSKPLKFHSLDLSDCSELREIEGLDKLLNIKNVNYKIVS